MTRIELRDATGSLSEYTRKARKGPVVVTRRGRPVALLRVVTDAEWEDFVVSSSPAFRRLIERSRRDLDLRCPEFWRGRIADPSGAADLAPSG